MPGTFKGHDMKSLLHLVHNASFPGTNLSYSLASFAFTRGPPNEYSFASCKEANILLYTFCSTKVFQLHSLFTFLEISKDIAVLQMFCDLQRDW